MTILCLMPLHSIEYINFQRASTFFRNPEPLSPSGKGNILLARASQLWHCWYFEPDDSSLWGCPVYCRMFSSTPGLHPLDVSRTPLPHQKPSSRRSKSPGGQNHLQHTKRKQKTFQRVRKNHFRYTNANFLKTVSLCFEKLLPAALRLPPSPLQQKYFNYPVISCIQNGN